MKPLTFRGRMTGKVADGESHFSFERPLYKIPSNNSGNPERNGQV